VSDAKLEAVLARLYTDAAFREAFLAHPADTARAAGLQARDVDELARIDREGLELAARSYAHKRSSKTRTAPATALPSSAFGRWWAALRGLW